MRLVRELGNSIAPVWGTKWGTFCFPAGDALRPCKGQWPTSAILTNLTAVHDRRDTPQGASGELIKNGCQARRQRAAGELMSEGSMSNVELLGY